jgi:hypothetical protein
LSYIGQRIYFLSDFLVDFCVESWEGAEDGWLEVLNILNKVFEIAAGVAYCESKHYSINMNELFLDMS